MLNPTQVDLSIIFPKLNTADGNPTNPMPEFLSGEKRQAVRTSTLIPPAKKVKRINEECNRTQLQNYLYVSSYSYKATKLTLSRSKYSIDLSQDLDDAAVSILVQNGLDNKFPAACGAWKSRNAESKETARKSIIEEKQRVDRKRIKPVSDFAHNLRQPKPPEILIHANQPRVGSKRDRRDNVLRLGFHASG